MKAGYESKIFFLEKKNWVGLVMGNETFYGDGLIIFSRYLIYVRVLHTEQTVHE